ncbi:hypothetical protein [Corynebacterium epidermidicanis]|uniref:LGFP repeat protein n=1 Tax=Corynebacterium epidermidicanis TaxID=1050174 RepID=A0A0G3GPL2_9CORY|nr:hypothetical protein [Corynebacterium epidermidicanis]AKK03116.1 LGFP repeat protein [Corynebacterium epidermidicanis]
MFGKKIVASVASSFVIFSGIAAAQTDLNLDETNKWYAEVLADETMAQAVNTDSMVSEELATNDAQATTVDENISMETLGLVTDMRVKQDFEGGARAFVTRNCQAFLPFNHQVCGAILAKYLSMGGPTSWLLWPTSGELLNPDGVGARSQFQNGLIYWHPNHGAWSVQPLMMEIWGRTGYERGVLSYPVTDSFAGGDRIGQKQLFAGGGAYWKLGRGAAVYGKINEKYVSMGAETSWLGYPVAEEVGLPDGAGRMSRFEHGWIYWHPQHGAHPVGMDMFRQWGEQGYERGVWGYPTADPVMDADGAYETQVFQGGQKSGMSPTLWVICQYSNRQIIPEVVSRAIRFAEISRKPTKEVLRESAQEVALLAFQDVSPGHQRNQAGIRAIGTDGPSGSNQRIIYSDPEPHRVGDVYKNWAGKGSTNILMDIQFDSYVNYDHVGIFIRPDTIVEAEGLGKTARSFGIDQSPIRPDVQRFHVDSAIDPRTIQAAASFAEQAANRQTPYDANPFVNKGSSSDDYAKLNCSELVWRAYHAYSGIDLDSNGGPGVWPKDIVNSGYLKSYG